MRYLNNHEWQKYDYFQWLLEKIECPTAYNHSLLLKDLHHFRFESVIERDENRALDGVDLRYQYIDEENLPDDNGVSDMPCSVLEMMIGMAERFTYDVIGRSFAGTEFWFWKMIDNLGLTCATDDNYSYAYVEQKVETMLKRSYKRNGLGGLFPLKRDKKDQRNIELWYQLCAWFEENYGIEIIKSRWDG